MNIIKVLLFVIIWTNMTGYSYSQVIGDDSLSTLDALKIGDKIPDALWNHSFKVVNHPEGKNSITLNEYKGKLIILDFWARWCSVCLKAFPKMNSIQKKFRDQVQIISVNTEVEVEKSVLSSFLTDYSSKSDTPFLNISIVKDTLLRKIIPFKLIPHYTWIDENGVIVAASTSDGVDPDNIKKLLTGKNVSFNQKIDKLNFDHTKPFLFDNDVIERSELKFGSALSKGINGLSSMSSLNVKIKDPVSRIFMINASPQIMLLSAFRSYGIFNNNRISLEVTDPKRLRYFVDDKVKQEEWESENIYSYELYSPEKSKEKVFEKFQNDLLDYFSLEVRIENRELDCWNLAIDNQKLLKYINTQNTNEGQSKEQTIQQLANLLDAKLPMPVVNTTDFKKKFRIELPEDVSNMKKLIPALRKAGIYLKNSKRDFPVFVVTDKKGADKN